MAGYKETPRQKMIAMMYLVLTALLALNVSKEILDAFLIVNDSMETTNEAFGNKINSTYSQFEFQNQLNPAKVGPYWEKALEAQRLSDELIDYIEQIKLDIVTFSERLEDQDLALQTYYSKEEVPDPRDPSKMVEKYILNLETVETKDKYDRTTTYFINQGNAKILKQKIDDYRVNIMNLVDEKYKDKIEIGLRTDGDYRSATGAKETWEDYNFYATILAADVTILNKFINEILTAEFDVVSELFDEIDVADFKFDEVRAKVIPKTSYILKGEKYEAEVLVAAYDSRQEPEVYILKGADEITDGNIGRAQRIAGAEGVVQLDWVDNTEGTHKYAGIIRILDPTGAEQDYPFSHEYIVAPPSLTVAAKKMNVFYIGVDNPVSISVPGIAKDQIRPSISTGNIKADPSVRGDWIVTMPSGTKKAVVSASAEYQGEMVSMGSAEFRVKKVPDPVAEIAGMVQGQIEKNTLMAAGAIIPELKDFEFELYFTVNSFKMITIIGGDLVQKNARGNRFTEDMMNIMKDSRRKQRFLFENIQATSPDGTTRTLNPINLEIK